MARPALWRANVAEASQLHADCRPHTGVGDWRQHGDLQRVARRDVAFFAVSATRTVSDGLGKVDEGEVVSTDTELVTVVSCMALTQRSVFGCRGV